MSPNVSKNRDKQSLHFILRSGLAGGIAGCVVSLFFIPEITFLEILESAG
jgi:hypothetical protein